MIPWYNGMKWTNVFPPPRREYCGFVGFSYVPCRCFIESFVVYFFFNWQNCNVLLLLIPFSYATSSIRSCDQTIHYCPNREQSWCSVNMEMFFSLPPGPPSVNSCTSSAQNVVIIRQKFEFFHLPFLVKIHS